MIGPILAALGALGVCVGLWFIYWPLAVIAGGAALLAVGLRLEVTK